MDAVTGQRDFHMARVRLDRMVVLDLEETCWDGEPPAGERAEIIEIGIAEVLLDGPARIGRTASLTVRPRFSRISPFCTRLTGITPEAARRGRPLGEAVATVRQEFGGAGKTWAAWGRDDIPLARDCAAVGVAPPAHGGFVDIGALWAMLSGAERAEGLKAALESLGLVFDGTQHRALDDAVNAARVVIALSGMLRERLAAPPREHPREP